MPRKFSHTEKTPRERSAYFRYVKKLDYTPTVDQSISFPVSNEPGEDLSQPTTKRRRKIPLGTNIGEHLKLHWVEWLFGCAVFVGIYFVFNSKIEISGLNIRFTEQEERQKELKQTSKERDKQLQEHEVKLHEHDIRLDNLEKGSGKKEPEKSP